jgi:hypothetical protein
MAGAFEHGERRAGDGRAKFFTHRQGRHRVSRDDAVRHAGLARKRAVENLSYAHTWVRRSSTLLALWVARGKLSAGKISMSDADAAMMRR